MASLIAWYREGGWAMFVITLLICVGVLAQLVALAVAIAGRTSGKGGSVARGLGIVAVLFALAPGCMGLFGYELAMTRVERAVSMVAPEKRALIEEAGSEEASHNLSLGFGGALCLLLPAVLTFFVAPSKPVDPGY